MDKRKSSKMWFYGVTSAVASLALIFTVNTLSSFGKSRMVYAMEQALKTVKAHHLVLEAVETNSKGKSATQSKVEVRADKEGHYMEVTPQIEVPVDFKAEEGDQKNVDAGHSPWKLDPAFVAQVFVGLKISPEGIQGEYPIGYEEFKVVQNTGKAAVVEVGGNKTPIRRVYLKRLIRQDSTGIWTIVGYDPVKK